MFSNRPHTKVINLRWKGRAYEEHAWQESLHKNSLFYDKLSNDIIANFRTLLKIQN